MQPVRIVVISDTHIGPGGHDLPPALIDLLRSADLILHAGDIISMDFLTYLRTLGRVEAVHGNVDTPEVRAALPATRIVQAGPFLIGLVHGDGPGSSTIERARRAFDAVDCIVFGHSHIPTVERYRSILMVNPGSPTAPRHSRKPSCARITAGAGLEAEIVYL